KFNNQQFINLFPRFESMRLDKFTLRGQEAIQTAIEAAEKQQNQQVEPAHLLFAMLEQPEGIVRPILGKLGANVQVILNDVQAAIGRLRSEEHTSELQSHLNLV